MRGRAFPLACRRGRRPGTAAVAEKERLSFGFLPAGLSAVGDPALATADLTPRTQAGLHPTQSSCKERDIYRRSCLASVAVCLGSYTCPRLSQHWHWHLTIARRVALHCMAQYSTHLQQHTRTRAPRHQLELTHTTAPSLHAGSFASTARVNDAV